ncbi:hypothetical protein [Nonomuraea sp. NPDC049695]|uniref:hypothetical protein n=1 Tax=Nonomuraea sp. NPDC049695 TaxID=3154734 RepID=UPI00342225D9
MVALSPIKGPTLGAVLALTCLSCTAAASTQAQTPRINESASQSDAQRIRAVIGNAIMAANPEYYIEVDDPSLTEKNSANELRLPFSVKPLGFEGITKTVPWLKRYEVSVNGTGTSIRSAPQLPATAMTGFIQGVRNRTELSIDKTLARMPQSLRVFAVVELKDPLHPSDLKKVPTGFITDVFFSPLVSGRRPVFWRMGPGCESMFLPPCKSDTDVVAQFKSWVGMLQPSDGKALAQLGLDLGLLRMAATDSKIYGFVIDGPPETVRAYATGPDVKAAEIFQAIPEYRK